ncbi:hypothetical protein ACRJ4W_12955 [Streptomyces sp. GLT-R25]
MSNSAVFVPHFHWDREWYEPFQVFRHRLVTALDTVLETAEANPDFRFTVDGQMAAIEDYLEMRPENRDRLVALVTEGRIAIGPWLILLDEFLCSGETIVRNLQMGWAAAANLGGAMPIGYLPDMFGHVAQMPQIHCARRHRARGTVARCARLRRRSRLPLARARRLRGAHRVPLRRLRQRARRPAGARPDRPSAGRVRADDDRAVGRRSGTGDGRHRSQRARPAPGGLAAAGVRRGTGHHHRDTRRVPAQACARRGVRRRHRGAAQPCARQHPAGRALRAARAQAADGTRRAHDRPRRAHERAVVPARRLPVPLPRLAQDHRVDGARLGRRLRHRRDLRPGRGTSGGGRADSTRRAGRGTRRTRRPGAERRPPRRQPAAVPAYGAGRGGCRGPARGNGPGRDRHRRLGAPRTADRGGTDGPQRRAHRRLSTRTRAAPYPPP